MRLLRLPVPLLVGMVGLAVFCLGACGTQTDAGVHEVAEDPYLVPAEFPECRWQEGADVDYAEGGGYPTAREALVEYPLAELFYDNFEVIDQTGGTVTWQMSDARGTRCWEWSRRANSVRGCGGSNMLDSVCQVE